MISVLMVAGVLALATPALAPSVGSVSGSFGVASLGDPDDIDAVLSAPVELPDDYFRLQLVKSQSRIRSDVAKTRYGLSGAGYTIAVLDSGIPAKSTDFEDKVVALRSWYQRSFQDDFETDVIDRHGHGSHVAGIVAANGRNVGVAHGADLAVLKVTTDKGESNLDTVKAALLWVLEHHEEFGITAVNVSIADTSNRSDVDSAWNLETVRELRALDIAVVTAAGNSWDRYSDRAQPEGMALPAAIAETISVGAVDRKDELADFSQRLHESTDALHRTDIFAPGVGVVSSSHTKKFAKISGTSQAAPMVTGAVVLLQEHYERKHGVLPSVDQLEAWLRAGAEDVIDTAGTGKTYKRLDVLGALEATGIPAPRVPVIGNGIAFKTLVVKPDFNPGATSAAKLVAVVDRRGLESMTSTLEGLVVEADLAGVVRRFTLDRKGRAITESGDDGRATLRVRAERKRGKPTGRLKIVLKLKDFDGPSAWDDEGIVAGATGPVHFDVRLELIDAIQFRATAPMKLKSKPNQRGVGTLAK